LDEQCLTKVFRVGRRRWPYFGDTVGPLGVVLRRVSFFSYERDRYLLFLVGLLIDVTFY
jgi:hypothetical protein